MVEKFFHSDSGIGRSSVSLEDILQQQAIINGEIDDDDYQYDYDYFNPDEFDPPGTPPPGTTTSPGTGLTFGFEIIARAVDTFGYFFLCDLFY